MVIQALVFLDTVVQELLAIVVIAEQVLVGTPDIQVRLDIVDNLVILVLEFQDTLDLVVLEFLDILGQE